MPQPTAAEIQALSLSTQNFSPSYSDDTPSGFLSLAPTTTTTKQPTASPKAASESSAAFIATPTPAEIEAGKVKPRRSSSLASDESTASGKLRFLKLGDGQGDWSEDVAE